MDRTEWKIHAMININACDKHTHTRTCESLRLSITACSVRAASSSVSGKACRKLDGTRPLCPLRSPWKHHRPIMHCCFAQSFSVHGSTQGLEIQRYKNWAVLRYIFIPLIYICAFALHLITILIFNNNSFKTSLSSVFFISEQEKCNEKYNLGLEWQNLNR